MTRNKQNKQKQRTKSRKMRGGGIFRIPITGTFMDDDTITLPNPEDKLLFIDIPTDRSHKRIIDNIRRRLRKIIVEDLVYGYSYLSKQTDTNYLPENIMLTIRFLINKDDECRIHMDSTDRELPSNDFKYDLNTIIGKLNTDSKIEVIIIESTYAASQFKEDRNYFDISQKDNQKIYAKDHQVPSEKPAQPKNSNPRKIELVTTPNIVTPSAPTGSQTNSYAFPSPTNAGIHRALKLEDFHPDTLDPDFYELKKQGQQKIDE
jgi:hypothetical protein